MTLFLGSLGTEIIITIKKRLIAQAYYKQLVEMAEFQTQPQRAPESTVTLYG